MNNREDYLKDLETINAQIMAVEKEITDLDTKKAVQKRRALNNCCFSHYEE